MQGRHFGLSKMKLEELSKKVVFFLGAGATTEAGCKTSCMMIEDLARKIEKEGNKDEIEIYRFILSCLEYQKSWKNIEIKQEDYITNIEEFVFLLRKIINRDELIPHPMVGNWSEKILKFEYKKSDIFQTLLSKLEYTYLPSWLSFEIDKADSLLSPIKQFFSDTSDRSIELDFFTINYDLVLEKYFNSASQILLNDGFISGEWQNAFKPHVKTEKYSINYYKLHGSLNWTRSVIGVDDDGGQVRKEDTLPSTSFVPLLIFGQETKMLSVDPFLSLTSQFKDILEERDYYIIIGYSFFDTYINNLIIESVNKYPEKKLIIVSPFPGEKNKDEIAKKLAAKIKRIQESDLNCNIYNIKQISPDKLIILQMKASLFYKDYFANKGVKLIRLIKDLSKPDNPLS